MKVSQLDQIGIAIAERLSAEVDKTDDHGFALNTEYHQGLKDGLRVALQIAQDLGQPVASWRYLASRPQAERVF